MPTQNLLLMLMVRIMLVTGTKLLFRLWAQGLVNIFKLKFRKDFEAGVWLVCLWCFLEVMKLNLGQYPEARFGQDFNFSRDADGWSRFWSWCFIEILWYELNPWVHCAFGKIYAITNFHDFFSIVWIVWTKIWTNGGFMQNCSQMSWFFAHGFSLQIVKIFHVNSPSSDSFLATLSTRFNKQKQGLSSLTSERQNCFLISITQPIVLHFEGCTKKLTIWWFLAPQVL